MTGGQGDAETGAFVFKEVKSRPHTSSMIRAKFLMESRARLC
jgi:hypothetical protein